MINISTQWKNGSVDVTIMHQIAPRSVWAQCAECSRRFQYTLHITKEPIREQEINLECMNSQELLHMLTIDTFQCCVSFHMHSANKWMRTLDLWIYNIWDIYMLYFKLICCLCFAKQLEWDHVYSSYKTTILSFYMISIVYNNWSIKTIRRLD